MWSNSTVEMMSAVGYKPCFSGEELTLGDRLWLTFCDVLNVTLVSKASAPPSANTRACCLSKQGIRSTHCVNFHVGDPASPRSTMFLRLWVSDHRDCR